MKDTVIDHFKIEFYKFLNLSMQQKECPRSFLEAAFDFCDLLENADRRFFEAGYPRYDFDPVRKNKKSGEDVDIIVRGSEWILQNFNYKEDTRVFVLSLIQFYRTFGYLSEKQFLCLKDFAAVNRRAHGRVS